MVKIFDKQAILENRIRNLENQVEKLTQTIELIILEKK